MQVVLSRSIYIVAETLRNVGILLQPFMPEKAEEMLDILGVSPDRRTFEEAGFGKDFTYGQPMRAPGRSAHESLFPPLEVQT